MRNVSPFILSMFVLGVILGAQPGIADITPIDYSPPPSGGGVSPKSPHETIRLESQEVIIRLKSSSYTVDAIFHLFNSGDTATEWVGFPKRSAGRPPGPLGRLSEFIRFDVSVDGRKIPLIEEPDQKSDALDLPEGLRRQDLPKRIRQQLVEHASWLMGRTQFPASSGMTIRVSYEASYDSCGYDCYLASYIYGTGRHWKDSIGKAVFIIDATEKGGFERATTRFSSTNSPRSWIHRRLITDNLTRYEIRDFEPEPGGTLLISLSDRRAEKDLKYALVHAAMNGRLERVKSLVEKGADVNAAGSFGRTPLMVAASHGHMPVAKFLLEKGADVNAKTKGGGSALKEALRNADGVGDQVSVAKLLKDHGAKPTILETAAFIGDMEAVKRFLEADVDLNVKGTRQEPSPLMAAALGGQCEVVKLLLERGANIETKDEYGNTPLIKAAATGQVDVIKLLLAQGANVNARNVHRKTTIEKAAWWGHADAVKALADGGADINARDDPADRTPLMHAAQMGRLEAVKALLEKGANVNATDRDGRTALTFSQGKDIEKIEKVLKDHGAK